MKRWYYILAYNSYILVPNNYYRKIYIFLSFLTFIILTIISKIALSYFFPQNNFTEASTRPVFLFQLCYVHLTICL